MSLDSATSPTQLRNKQAKEKRMAEALDIAVRELEYTVQQAKQYLSSSVRYAEILRSHCSDLQEDIAALDKLKNSYGDKAAEIAELVADAKRQKRTADKAAYSLEIAAKQAALAAQSQREQAQSAEPVSRTSGIKLPRIKLPNFDGESSDDYRGFKQAFEETIKTEPDLSNIRKWLLLKAQLSGKALQMVKELPLVPETYEAGLKILDNAYGSTRKSTLKLYQRLQMLPTAESEIESLRMVHAKMEGILLTLTNLKVDPNNDDFLRAVILSKFPSELLYALKVNDEMTLNQFRSALGEYIQARDCVIQQMITVPARNSVGGFSGTKLSNSSSSNESTNYGGSKGGASGPKDRLRHGKSALTSAGGDAKKSTPPDQVTDSNLNTNAKKERPRLHSCIFCSGEHWSDQCDVVKSLEDRVKIVADRCQKCLRSAHPNSKCERWTSCSYCKETTHNRAICPKTFGPNGKILLAKAETCSRSKTTKFITAVIAVCDETRTQSESVRAVFDTAGSHSLITNGLAKRLGIANSSGKRIRLCGIQGATLATDARATKLLLLPPSQQPIELEAYVVPEIVRNVEATSISQVKKRYPECQQLVMPEEGNGREIDLLLGYHSLTRIVTLQTSKQIGDLQLLSTKFGWIPFGDPQNTEETMNADAPICLLTEVDPIKIMCDLQEIGLAEFLHTENEEQEIVLEKFHSSIKRVGRQYQIQWPYKYEPPELENNFGLAVGRLTSLHKQLVSAPDMLRAYDAIIRDQLETDVVEVVNTQQKKPCGRVHYLPHRGVLRFGKSTPIRMVFDASSRSRKGAKSLNDNIYKGGNWVTDLPGILLRFRRYNVAITADICRAFHQILIAPTDRDVTRFLWLRNIFKPPTTDNIVVYRFKRMAFGIVASPFLLTATIKYHLKENAYKFGDQVETDMYADNLVTSIPDNVAFNGFYRSIKTIFDDMGMNMTQWCTEDDRLRSEFQNDDATVGDHQLVLGIPWNLRTKTLSIKGPNIQTRQEEVITKRIALKEMAKVYDPLGWSIPVVLLARIFLRKIWLQEYAWDTPFPDDLKQTWYDIQEELNRVSEIQIPRTYVRNGLKATDDVELHAFCDASAEAYGVVVYIRIIDQTTAQTNIVAAKAKLSPKTQLSIPRLELLAAVIAVRYLRYVENNLKLENKIKRFLWGDSRCVISWVVSNKLLPPFIQKAVTEIRNAQLEKFSYVPTNENPADVVSRGAGVQILRTQKWWTGPPWLTDTEKWPKQQQLYEENEKLSAQVIDDLQMEEAKILLLKSSIELKHPTEPLSTADSPFELDPSKFATFNQLLRATTILLKATTKFLRSRGTIAVFEETDYTEAKKRWIRWDQQRTYRTVNKEKSNISYLQNLKVTIDNDNLIRCVIRTELSETEEEIKPILLAKGTKLTTLIILSTHIANLHTGTSHTLASIRKQYWLPHGRRQVYQTIKKHCYTCRRYDAEPYKAPEMAPLPPFRISRTETPFKNTGVDVMGPFRTKLKFQENLVYKKTWIIMFTCLVIRAVHLEILKDMTAEEFLNSLRKFIGRRGTPALIVSDNAPQFKAVDGIFQCMWRRFAQADTTTKYYAEHQIIWKFIPAHAPWMGGAYERMVRTVKSTFEKVYQGKVLMEEQFELTLVEVEATVNSRPITYVDQEKETEIISPNDFLCVKYPAIPVDFERAPAAAELAAAWIAGRKRLDEFWHLWSERYLREIRERREKMKTPRRGQVNPPQPGELVLMVDPDRKRSAWRTAVVERVIKSSDGLVRSAQIRTAGRARMIRPISALAPLKLLMELPDDLPVLTDDQQNLVLDAEPGLVEL